MLHARGDRTRQLLFLHRLLPTVTRLDGDEDDNSAELLLKCLACSLWLEQLCGSVKLTRDFFHLQSGYLMWLQSVMQHPGPRLLLYQKQQDNNVLGVESEDEVTPKRTCWCATEAKWCVSVFGAFQCKATFFFFFN